MANLSKIKTKACRACGVEKALSAFNVRRSEADGLQGDCRECLKRKRDDKRRRDREVAQANIDANAHLKGVIRMW